MKCPFRMKAFDHPDECDPECAWLMRIEAHGKPSLACAVPVIAFKDVLILTKTDYGIETVRMEEE